MSLFDQATFLNQPVQGGFETKYPTIPVGEYPAISKKIDVRQMDSTKEPGKKVTVLDVTWSIDDAGVKEATKLPEPTARQSVFLDLDESGKLARGVGRNVQLGRFLEALGLNIDGQDFRWDQLTGKAAIVRVEHSPNEKDPENPYSNVTKVATQ